MRKNVAVLVALGLFHSIGLGQTHLQVSVENLQPADGLFFTPLWVGFHDGTFDFFDVGGTASPALEALAEGGETALLSADFSGMGIDGVVAPGTPFGPAGSSFASHASANFIVDATMDRYFSFASMMIPSNDAFFGNDSPLAYALFDNDGNFSGPVTIEIVGAGIYDAGTESNLANGGAAFSALGGDSVDEAMSISMHAGLENFVGTETANGETIGSAFSPTTAIARITISEVVPEPASWGLLAAACCGILARRRVYRR